MSTMIQLSTSSSTLNSGKGPYYQHRQQPQQPHQHYQQPHQPHQHYQHHQPHYNMQGSFSTNTAGATTILPASSSSSAISVGGATPSTDTGPRTIATNYPKVDEALEKMKVQLSRFTRANDRRMVLRTLKEVKYLKSFPVETQSSKIHPTIEELEEEIAYDMFTLNGQTFFPTKCNDENNNQKNSNRSDTKRARTVAFTTVLRALCSNLCEGLHGMSPTVIYTALLHKICRNRASNDVLDTFTKLVGPELIILPNNNNMNKKQQRIPAPGAKPELNLPKPIQITLFASDGCIHVHITTDLQYGLHRQSDVVNKRRAWIKMDAIYQERCNLTIGDSVRHVTTRWPDIYM